MVAGIGREVVRPGTPPELRTCSSCAFTSICTATPDPTDSATADPIVRATTLLVPQSGWLWTAAGSHPGTVTDAGPLLRTGSPALCLRACISIR